MDPWRLRLDTMSKGIKDLMSKGTGDDNIKKLQVLIDRFMTETHVAMEKLPQELIIEYTQLQMEAEFLTAMAGASSKVNQVASVNLPKLDLPKFNGNVLKWSEFWDRFHTAVHIKNLSGADKISYLKASLGHEPLSVIEGLDTTNENYEIAIDMLRRRYGQTTLLVDAHYEALYNLTKATSSPQVCMDTLNSIEKHLRVLSSKGEDINHNNLRSLIMNKFPDDLIYELKSKMESGEENIDQIRKTLEKIIINRVSFMKPTQMTTEALQVRDFNNRNIRNDSQGRKDFRNNPRINLKRKHHERDANPVPFSKNRKLMPCIFCSSNHFNSACPKSLSERKLSLKGKCFTCFKENHLSKDCKVNVKCYFCKGRHNSALCYKRDTKITTQKTNTYLGVVGETLLQTAIMNIKCNNEIFRCRALLDTGSQRSYITSELSQKLKLKILEENCLTVFTFGSSQPTNIDSPMTEVDIIGPDGLISTIRVNIMPYITEDIQFPPIDIKQIIPIKYRSKLADDGSLGKSIDILIGNDYYFSFIKTKRIKCTQNLFLVESLFGWIVSGKQDVGHKNELSVITYVKGEPLQINEVTVDRPIRNSNLHKLWDLETIGILDCPKATRDDQAVENFNKTIKFSQGRYWIKWPWTQKPTDLPSNFGLAFGRLVALLKRTNKMTITKYNLVFEDQLHKNIIEIFDPNQETMNYIHYLPHHCVVKEDKLRVVYDASSKAKDKCSLNECMYRGPLLLENLIGLLLRFRTYKYGIIADVEKAFLQIGIQSEDRDVTRFLWLKNIDKPPTMDNLRYFRFCRVPFGIGCSPFLLAITLKHHLERIDSPFSNRLSKDIYVDNLITGEDSSDNCIQLYKETKRAFDRISMNMRDWSTNNIKLNMVQDREFNKHNVVNVLGINWIMNRDELKLKVNLRTNEGSWTKRKVLAYISSVFDPCGYATPIMISSKLFLQELWSKKLDWDTELTLESKSKWQNIIGLMNELNYLSLPRWYGIDNSLRSPETHTEIHCFTDASLSAYAAVVYLRITQNNTNKTSFVISKSRLTPMKNRSSSTIPKLELLAVLIGCRLLTYAQRHLELKIDKQFIWSDSKIVLSWLKIKRVLPPFVSARIEEIKKSKEIEFRYIPTSLNPADLATRPCKEPLMKTLWFKGPSFLSSSITEWPKEQNINKEFVMMSRAETDELNIIRKLQLDHFPNELKGKRTDLTITLGLFVEEGILRCRGRFKMTDWPEDQKYPILLPSKSDFTNAKIDEVHKKLYHVGVSQTLANIRLKYWIPRGRSCVQRVLKKCEICRKYSGGPYKLPPTAQLPKERVKFTKPFTYTGTDYLGPLYVTSANGDIEKRWICLFTCLAVRAVHLEMVTNLTAEQALLAIRRMIATRGAPCMFLSDNASNYKLTAEVMTSKYCVDNNFEWRFIPQLSPWFGGVYERLVGLVKHCLRRTVDKHLLNESQLGTVIKEIEAVLNCRPLTTVGNDVEHTLTPADFLRVGGPLTLVESDQDNGALITDTKRSLVEGWKKGLIILEEFKRMFMQRYLQSLRERYTKMREPRSVHSETPKIGDIVQIKEDSPRVNWKVGKICELIQSSDKEIRVAKVKVSDKEFTRSVGHLYPLEIVEHPVEKNADAENNENNVELGTTNNERAATPENGRDIPNKNNVTSIEKGTESAENKDEIEGEKENGAEIEAANGNNDSEVEKENNGRISGRTSERKAAAEAKTKIAEWTKLLFVNNCR